MKEARKHSRKRILNEPKLERYTEKKVVEEFGANAQDCWEVIFTHDSKCAHRSIRISTDGDRLTATHPIKDCSIQQKNKEGNKQKTSLWYARAQEDILFPNKDLDPSFYLRDVSPPDSISSQSLLHCLHVILCNRETAVLVGGRQRHGKGKKNRNTRSTQKGRRKRMDERARSSTIG